MKAVRWGLCAAWSLALAAVMGTSLSAHAQTHTQPLVESWGQGQPPAGQVAPAPGQYPAPSQPAPSQPSQGQPYQNQPYQNQPYQNQPYQPHSGGAEQTLATADREDTGRGLEWVWVDAQLGFETATLQLSNGDVVVPTNMESASGISYGAAVGVRAIALTLGARFRYGNFSDWDLWSIDLEGGFHIPLGRLEPFIELGAGYSRVAAFQRQIIVPGVTTKDLDVDGFNVRLGGGLDYYVTPRFSVGAAVHGDFMALYGASIGAVAASKSLGYAVDAALVLGLHF